MERPNKAVATAAGTVDLLVRKAGTMAVRLRRQVMGATAGLRSRDTVVAMGAAYRA